MIIFVHQAKAAGTSLVEAFKATYGAGAVYHDEDNQRLWKMDKRQLSLEFKLQPYRKYKDREAYRVIHGHFLPDKYRGPFPDAFFMTFYRNPVQQIISNYNYWLHCHNPDDKLPLRRWVYEAKPSLVEFVVEWVKVIDIHVRAKIFTPQKFDFVGITERLDDSMKLLKLHIPELVIDIEAQRVNPDKLVGESYALTHDNEEILNNMLKPLILLYDEAVSRFDSDWDAAKNISDTTLIKQKQQAG